MNWNWKEGETASMTLRFPPRRSALFHCRNFSFFCVFFRISGTFTMRVNLCQQRRTLCRATSAFKHHNSLSRHVSKRRLSPAPFCFLNLHDDTLQEPPPVPVAPQFLDHVFLKGREAVVKMFSDDFAFFLYTPWTSSRRGGPPSLRWPWASSLIPHSFLILTPWNLSCSSTGSHSESLRAAPRLPERPHLYICMCIFMESFFGFECCAMVEFVDDRRTFCGNFIFLFDSSLGSDFY